MRRSIIIVGTMALAATLFVTGSICAKLNPAAEPGASEQVVAEMGRGERELIRQIDIADCRDGVVRARKPGSTPAIRAKGAASLFGTSIS